MEELTCDIAIYYIHALVRPESVNGTIHFIPLSIMLLLTAMHPTTQQITQANPTKLQVPHFIDRHHFQILATLE